MRVKKIEVSFAIPVDLTEEEMRVIDLVANRAARRTEDLTRVHWAAGCGSKPIWSKSDIAVGAAPGPVDPRAKDTGEPDFDDEVFYIETCCRERYDTEPYVKKAERSLAVEVVRWLQADRDAMAARLREVMPVLDPSHPTLLQKIRRLLRI